MKNYNLFVLDANDSFHRVERVHTENIDDACEQFFPADPDDRDHSKFAERYEIEIVSTSEVMIVDYDFEHSERNAHESLTYIVTANKAPSTREDMFA